MEKRRPTYDLDAIKATLGAAETLAITRTAFADALSLGFNRFGVATVIQAIRRQTFHTSMTSVADHRTWQDVYHVPTAGLTLSVTFQAGVVTAFRPMSFKER